MHSLRPRALPPAGPTPCTDRRPFASRKHTVPIWRTDPRCILRITPTLHFATNAVTQKSATGRLENWTVAGSLTPFTCLECVRAPFFCCGVVCASKGKTRSTGNILRSYLKTTFTGPGSRKVFCFLLYLLSNCTISASLDSSPTDYLGPPTSRDVISAVFPSITTTDPLKKNTIHGTFRSPGTKEGE